MVAFAGWWRISVVCVAASLVGCAARGPRAATTSPAESSAAKSSAAKSVTTDAAQAGTDVNSLSEFMEKIRHLSVTARPARPEVPTLETRDRELAAELKLVSSAPTAGRHRELAEHYRLRGVLDAAYRHFNRALALNPRDAEAYEGLARVWRDWGLPHLGVGDAHRATFYAPRSAAAHNTYGTLMQALGRYKDAKVAYELAGKLDPGAAYALNNLCYVSFLDGRIDAAIDTCTKAVKMDPSLAAAKNNLALAYAAAGRPDLARTHFLDAGDPASGLYNTGIVYLASRDYRNALAAFDAASRKRPTFNLARERARQLREMLRTLPANPIERLDGAFGQ